MSLNANALTTVARQKSFMGITVSTHDTALELLINSVSNYVEKVTGRKFKRQTFTNEIYNGKDSEHLYLKNYPVIDGEAFTLQQRVSALNEDNWETVDAEDYFVENESGRVTLITTKSFATAVTGVFTKGIQNWRVTYTAGFYLPSDASFGTNYLNDLPSDLEMLVWQWVAQTFNGRKSQGIQRQKVRDIEVWFAAEMAKDPMMKQTLMQYRRRSYG